MNYLPILVFLVAVQGSPTTAAKEFAELKQQYQDASIEFRAKMDGAITEAEKNKLLADSPNKKYLPRFNDLAEKHAKDPASFDMLVFALRNGNGFYFPEEQWERTTKLLEKHHADSKAMAEFAPTINPWGDPVISLLRTVMAKNPDKLTQARVCKQLWRSRVGLVQMAEHYNANPAIQDNLIRKTIDGQAFYKNLLANVGAYRKEIVELKGFLDGKYKGMIPTLEWGKHAPDVELTDLDGKKHKLTDYKGKIVVLNIISFGEGDRPSAFLEAQPRQARENIAKPYIVINAAIDSSKQPFVDYLKKHPIPNINCWVGPNSEVALDWLAEARERPTNFVIDAEGNYVFQGVYHRILDDILDKMFSEMGARGFGAMKATPATRAFVGLQDDFRTAMEEDTRQRKAARGPEDFAKIEANRPHLKFASRYVDVAKKHADDPATFHNLHHVLIQFSRELENREQMQAALDLLAKHQAAHPDMKGFLRSLASKSPRLSLYAVTEAESRLARAVLEKNDDMEAKAFACRLLATHRKNDLGWLKGYTDATPEARTRMEQSYPVAGFFKRLQGEGKESIEKEANRLRQMMEEKYVKILDRQGE